MIREIHGDDHPWGLTEHLLAATVDALNVANWLQTKDAIKGRNRPKQITRPGVQQQTRVREAVSMEEMKERLARKRRLSVVPDPVDEPTEN